ncbi:MAG: energy-coupling factor transporter transmembrane protein EcfT [Candidatus Thorarchaeota archaeon]|nr:energy-coupling factor transporter transmembrane protein EcfT [Candidatus Thorarchaeota archaeon]
MSSNLGYVQHPTSKLNPLLNLMLLIILLLGIMIYQSWQLSLILLAPVLSGFKLSRVSLQLSRRRTKFIVLFSIVLFLFQIIITPNGTLFGFIIPQIHDFGPFFPVTSYGVERGLSISIRFLLIIFSSMLFVSITDPTLLAHSLTLLRIPFRYSFALVIALRFLPLFDAENQTVRLAQKSRGIEPEIGGLHKILRTIQYTFFPLLVSSLSRVEALSMSMDGRGFGFSSTRTYMRKSEWKLRDSLILLCSFAYLLLCILLASGLLPQIAIFL